MAQRAAIMEFKAGVGISQQVFYPTYVPAPRK